MSLAVCGTTADWSGGEAPAPSHVSSQMISGRLYLSRGCLDSTALCTKCIFEKQSSQSSFFQFHVPFGILWSLFRNLLCFSQVYLELGQCFKCSTLFSLFKLFFTMWWDGLTGSAFNRNTQRISEEYHMALLMQRFFFLLKNSSHVSNFKDMDYRIPHPDD